MSLNTSGFKADLKEVYTRTYEASGDKDAALDAFIDAFADKLEAYIRTADILYNNGLTAGSAPVTGTFNGHLQ
ncbi:hypothetical protein SNE26_20340 [Mucilaginibacter sp. cycad4]|uniref:hypothetical protein n=1 Tax=Mucilaginibacter sp. cycad4 TaxID=3342096 RepID=UPI002AAC0451|nr:hypothetical protein [Mucilaginibacter gossypii]WPU98378.1 hypothetical protein SNE26_20340 [Mucilaginibacter gossypii]